MLFSLRAAVTPTETQPLQRVLGLPHRLLGDSSPHPGQYPPNCLLSMWGTSGTTSSDPFQRKLISTTCVHDLIFSVVLTYIALLDSEHTGLLIHLLISCSISPRCEPQILKLLHLRQLLTPTQSGYLINKKTTTNKQNQKTGTDAEFQRDKRQF